MRRDRLPELACYALAALCACLAGFPTDAPARREFQLGPPPAGGLRVVTWNVGGSGGGPGGRPLLDEHVPHVAASLLAFEPDLVLLQELADVDQVRRLAEALAPGAPFRQRAVRGRLVAVIARHGRLREHSATSDPRAAHLHVLWQSAGGRSLAGASVHAHPWSAEERNLAIGEVWSELEQSPATARLLAGDLNLDVDPGARRDLFSDRVERDVETYAFLASRWSDAGLGSGSTAEPERRLDYVFHDERGLRLLQCAPARAWRLEDMDHHPLIADFEWR